MFKICKRTCKHKSTIQQFICSKRLLHNNFSNTYLSRYNSDSLNYQCQHRAYNSVNYQRHYHWVQFCSLSVSIWTLAINWSMSQSGHDPHSYNPVNYQGHFYFAWSCEICHGQLQWINQCLIQDMIHKATNPWTINATIPLGVILLALSTRQ